MNGLSSEVREKNPVFSIRTKEWFSLLHLLILARYGVHYYSSLLVVEPTVVTVDR